MGRTKKQIIAWRLRCLAILLLAGYPPLLCAAASVELRLGSREVFVGEAVELQIQVNDFSTCDPPEVPEIANATIRQTGGTQESSQMSVFNGHMTQSITRVYPYELTPNTVGELVIPPIAVKVDGQVLKTREVRLTVRPSDADRLFAIDISAGRNRLYVGQRVRLTMTMWVKPARYGSQLLSAGQMIRLLRPIDLGPFPPQLTNDPQRPRPRPGGDPSDTFYAFEFAADFVPEHPGPLSFDNIEVGIDYPARGGTRSLRAHPVVAPTEILPVPMDGRPPDFNGAVGLYAIETTANPTDVRVGDPIELTIDVFGEGPVETLPPPLLSANAKLNEDFRLPDEQLAGEMQDGRRRFKVTIRARRDGVTQIPPLAYPYFDPDAERFVVAHSKPIPLNVAPAAEVAPLDLTTARPTPPPTTSSPLQALDGLRDIETSETALLASTTPITPRLVTAVLLAPPALFLLACGALAYVQQRSADPARRRRQLALRAARRRIVQARAAAVRTGSGSDGPDPRALAGEVSAALAGYLADRLNEPAGHFTGSTAVDFLRSRNLRPDLVDQCAAVVQRCEEASFGGGTPADGDALCGAALDCLQALERQKL